MKQQLYMILQKGFYGIFPVLAFMYFLIVVDTSIIDFKYQSISHLNIFFFIKYFTFTAVIAEYISLFFSQLLYSNFSGSFIITLLIPLTLFISSQFLKKSTLNPAYNIKLNYINFVNPITTKREFKELES